MNFKKKLKKFFTLNRRADDGFTLVELVVVIAILGVLAGVGTVGYSGYVKKANLAADEQLLAVVNQAFAAACIDNGVNIYDENAVNTGNAKLKIEDKQLEYGSKDLVNEKITTAFDGYLGTGSRTFKVFEALKFLDGQFVNANVDVYASLVFDEGLVGRVVRSVFMTNAELGVDNLMNRVDFIASMAAGVADRDVNDGAGNGAWQMLSRYNTKMFEDLGVVMPTDEELAGKTETEIEAAYAAAFAPLYALRDEKVAMLNAQNGGGVENWDGLTDSEKATVAENMILSTYAILDAAKGMKGQSTDTVLTTISGTSNFKEMLTNSQNENGVAMASAAYGLYTAYAYEIENEADRAAAIAKLNDPIALMKGMDDQGFKNYLGTQQAKDDLDGYMAAMELIGSNADKEEAIRSMMINGITDPALLAVLNQQLQTK